MTTVSPKSTFSNCRVLAFGVRKEKRGQVSPSNVLLASPIAAISAVSDEVRWALIDRRR